LFYICSSPENVRVNRLAATPTCEFDSQKNWMRLSARRLSGRLEDTTTTARGLAKGATGV